MYADENVIKIKHDVLYEVAKLAFAGELPRNCLKRWKWTGRNIILLEFPWEIPTPCCLKMNSATGYSSFLVGVRAS